MTVDDNSFSLFDLWDVCRSHRTVIFISAFFILAVFTAYAVLKTPVYRAEVVVMPSEGIMSSGFESRLGGLSGLGVLAGLMPRDSGSVEAMATIKSGVFLRSFIETHDIVPVLYESLWDEESDDWRSDIEAADIPTVMQAAKRFKMCCLTVNQGSSDQLTTIAIEWRDPVVAAAWANDLVVDLNSALQKREIEEAESMIAYLEAELEKTNVVGLQQAIFGLIEQQVQRKTFARVRTEFAYRIVDPAVVSAPGAYVRPNRPVVMATGLFGGVLVGIFFALLLSHMHAIRSVKQTD